MGRRSVEKERHWREIVARHERSGMKVRAFCDQEQIKECQFFAWRRELRHRDVAQAANRDTRSRGVRDGRSGSIVDTPLRTPQTTAAFARESAAFAPLHVVGNAPVASSAIEIIVSDGRRVAVAPGFDPEALAKVLAVVEGRTC